jgi:hypothetical protein
MLMQPASKRVNDKARLPSGSGNGNEKERHMNRVNQLVLSRTLHLDVIRITNFYWFFDHWFFR